ncbi:unnamed protein product [Aureobasidium pullulans]|nr:unnamed protein product [Aureobasidium pullulans]
MAAFHFQAERFSQARDLFQTALNACVKAGAKDSELDTDSLVTSISYNLARTYEAENMLDEANQVYQGLLERHPDYTDARIRLAYIALRENPQKVLKQLRSCSSQNQETSTFAHSTVITFTRQRSEQ